MTGTSWFDWSGPDYDVRRGRSLEDRAALTFKIVALLNLPGIIVTPFGGPASTLLAITSVGATIGLTALYFLEAWALDRRRPWALLATRPLLAVLTVFGLYSMLVAFDEGWLKVPFDAAFAIWAWLSRPEASPGPRPRRPPAAPVIGSSKPRPALRATAIVVLAVVLEAVLWYGDPVFGWGGLLDAHQPDLSANLQVDCGPPGGGLPATVTVTYDWSWRTRPPLPSGLDVLVVGWQGVDELGRTLYVLGDTPVTGPGIEPSLQGFPSLEMAEAVETELPGWSWHWGIHLDRQRLAPGHIEFQLERGQDAPPQPGPMTMTATYIHLGLWRSSAPSVTCTW